MKERIEDIIGIGCFVSVIMFIVGILMGQEIHLMAIGLFSCVVLTCIILSIFVKIGYDEKDKFTGIIGLAGLLLIGIVQIRGVLGIFACVEKIDYGSYLMNVWVGTGVISFVVCIIFGGIYIYGNCSQNR